MEIDTLISKSMAATAGVYIELEQLKRPVKTTQHSTVFYPWSVFEGRSNTYDCERLLEVVCSGNSRNDRNDRGARESPRV